MSTNLLKRGLIGLARKLYLGTKGRSNGNASKVFGSLFAITSIRNNRRQVLVAAQIEQNWYYSCICRPESFTENCERKILADYLCPACFLCDGKIGKNTDGYAPLSFSPTVPGPDSGAWSGYSGLRPYINAGRIGYEQFREGHFQEAT